MKIVIIGDEVLKDAWLSQGIIPGTSVEWFDTFRAVDETDAYIDLSYGKQTRYAEFDHDFPALLMVNSVENTLPEIKIASVRFNGWPGFLKSPSVEACAFHEKNKILANKIFACFNKSAEWVADSPGMVLPRVLAMIINEAYRTLEEKISNKQEIDIAMKLGANYPLGPFEWSEKIGLKKIYSLLQKLSAENKRYEASELLKREAEQS
jgi:3-hydroxybutyryl-CoA dehydrogenase